MIPPSHVPTGRVIHCLPNVLLLTRSWGVQVWTPLQYARALCSAFPWTLDPLSVANCLAQAEGEPSAEAILAGQVPHPAAPGQPRPRRVPGGQRGPRPVP